MLNQQITALQDLEHVGHLAVDDRKGDGSARLEWNVLEIGAVYAVQLHEAGEVQGTGQPLHGRRLDLELPHKEIENAIGHLLAHLQSDGRAESSLADRFFKRFE